jgi:hypothetical protein
MRWAGHVELYAKEQVHAGVWRGDLRERDQFKNLAMDGHSITMYLQNRAQGMIKCWEFF